MKKIRDLLTILSFCVFLAVFAVLFLVLPEKPFSETENRPLQTAPAVSTETILSGTLADQTNLWFSDQFPLRDGFVRLKSAFELLLCKGENNGVLYSDSQLAVRAFDAYDSRLHIAENADWYFAPTVKAQLERYGDLVGQLSVPVVTLIPPRTVDVADSAFPYDRPYGDGLYDLFSEVLPEKAGYLELLPDLRAAYERGEYVIYRTDHHWTTLGAYTAYQKVASALGIEEVPPAETLTKTEIPDFFGTTAARASFPWGKPDVITLYDDGENYTVTADGETLDGLYDFRRARSSDKYTVFLGGTHGVTTVKGNGDDRKTLLVFKDSFADSLIPFLAHNFDIVALDLKTHPDLTAAIGEYHPEAVLVVYNAENLITNAAFGNLR